MTEPKVLEKKTKKRSELFELIIVVFQATILALLVRTFIFQPYIIPSGSMRPTLLVGDCIIASKYAYGYSRYSFPFSLNLFSGRVFGELPKRGDVIVFNHKDAYTGEHKNFIKRLIGLPGDKIQVINGRLYINGSAVQQKMIGILGNSDITGVVRPVEVYQETLPNGVTFNTLSLTSYGPGDDTRMFIVPKGHYFMMGDNRDDSEDSRFSLGYIPYEELVAKAKIIFLSMENETRFYQFWRWFSDMRWKRIFSFVSTLRPLPGLETETLLNKTNNGPAFNFYE